MEVAESCEDWETAVVQVQVSHERVKVVATGKAAALVSAAEKVLVTVTPLPLDQVRKRAIASSNAFHEEMPWGRGHNYEKAGEQSDPAFLARITVNHLRHHLTVRDEHLDEH